MNDSRTRRFSGSGRGRPLYLLCLCGVGLALSVVQARAGTLVSRASTWQYHKGTSEASDPIDDWRELDFESAGWSTGSAPFGYGSGANETDIVTRFNDMQNSYTTFFIRKTFAVSAIDPETRLRAMVDYDDGFIIWINGERVWDKNEPDGSPLYVSLASADHESGTFETNDLPSPEDYLEIGENVIAVQAFNAQPGSSDCKLDVELSTYRRVADTTFSADRGFYGASFEVTISTATPDATIRYTTDGSWPTSAHGSTGGTNKVLPISTTTCLRAAAYKSGYEPCNVDTHTYIFLDDVIVQPNTMSGEDWIPGDVSSVTRASQKMNTAMDSRVLNAEGATRMKEALRALPTLSLVADYGDIFGNSHGIFHNSQHDGDGWERAVSAELIHPDGTPGFQINCGTQISGAWSRRGGKAKLSMSLRFKKIYGPGKLQYEFFPGYDVDSFDHIRLRAQGNDCWSGHLNTKAMYVRDEWGRQTQREMGWISPKGTWMHVYINGMYWGLYNPVEGPDSSFIAAHFGGEKEDYDVHANQKPTGLIPAPPPPNTLRTIDGDDAAFAAMSNIVWNTSLGTTANYEALQTYVDVPQHIDYMMLNTWVQNEDWDPVTRPQSDPYGCNWRAGRKSRNRLPGDPQFQFFIWDIEVGMLDTRPVSTNYTFFTGIFHIHDKLTANADYRVLFGDRIYRHMIQEGGAMTPASLTNRWKALCDEIELPLIAESARWGDAVQDTPSTVPDTWIPARNTLMNNWLPLRGAYAVSHWRAAGLYPSIEPPGFSAEGGAIASGFRLTLSNPTAYTVYYSTDGTDPRRPGGSRSPDATAYTGPLPLSRTTHVKARVWKTNGTWSALHETTFNYTAHYGNIRITEILYNPLGGSEFEFVELTNTGASTRGLSMMTFRGIGYTFPPGVELGAGQTAVLVNNEAAFTNRYPGVRGSVAFFAQYRGKLDNGGERLALLDGEGRTVTAVRYNDKDPWPEPADGDGFSLVPVSTDGDQDDPAKWRASNLIGGSPGYDDGAPYRVVINEALTHTDLPQVDAIELYNAGAAGADIGGWYLSDDSSAYRKFRIPDGTTLAPGAYVVFDEPDFNTDTNDPACFALSSHGDEIYLTKWDADNNLQYLAEARFGGAQNGVAFGRYVKSAGDTDFVEQNTTNTLGAANAPPRVGPVVINEIMYHPVDGALEFVELYNISDGAVDLYDPAWPTNGWRLSAAIDYTFPAGTSIGARDCVLVVPTNETAFRAAYPGVPADVAVFGPYTGRLGNGGESVKLWRPDSPDPEGVPWILVDRVQYDDNSPWPEIADGDGPSLERQDPAAYGNDPVNWAASVAAGGTPGERNSGGLVSPGAGWRYHDRGEDLGTAWRALSYDDTAWHDGNAPLGYGDAGDYPELDTEIAYGDDPANKPITAYFRKTFTLAAAPGSVTNLALAAKYDDGFVAYLNGQEIARGNMPGGTILFSTPAASSHTADAYETFDLSAHADTLLQGVNVLVVEMHQSGPGSSDLLMDVALTHAASQGNPPAAPQNLVATAQSSTRIDLRWTDASGNEAGFKLDRRMSGAQDWERVATLAANQTAHSDSGLPAGTTFYYKIKAYNADGNSAYSAVAAATTHQGPPAAPSALSATPASASRINLRWTDNSGNEDTFRIERSPNGSSGWAPVGSVSADTTLWTDSGLAPAAGFYYRVRASNAVGESGYSNVDGATTAAVSVQFAVPSSSGNESASPANLSVELSEASVLAVTVNFASGGGTATAGADYGAAAGTLSFTPGQTARTISVAIIDNTLEEPDETFVVTLAGPAGAALGGRTAHTYTIRDNDTYFSAYNDLYWESGQLNTRITTYTTGQGGQLVDYATGEAVAATLTVMGGNPYLAGANANAGTDAYDVFGGIVDCAGVIGYVPENLQLQFSALDPNLRFELVLFGNRDNADYAARTATVTLSGAASFANASTPGTHVFGTDNCSTLISNGYNTAAGYVARFKDIDPGADGIVIVTVSDNDSKFYANAVMLKAGLAGGGLQEATKIAAGALWRYRKGSTEASNPAAAWRTVGFDDSAWSTGSAPFGYGTGPFGTTLADMKNSYSSLFLRSAFSIQHSALISEVQLRVDYDDGFILWLNGRELARVNMTGDAGSFLPCTTLATGYVSAASATWTGSFSGSELPALGADNILAVQVFNVSQSSGDLMLDAELRVMEGSTASGDGDQDGMSDSWETTYFGGTAATNGGTGEDFDGDGVKNIDEYIAGTNPNDIGKTFRVDLAMSSGTLTVSFPTIAAGGAGYEGLARHYALERRSGLNRDAVWEIIPGCSNILGAGQTVTHQETTPNANTCYQARVWLE
ncbi:MAG: lamin tail domain-containing protein [Kiritimatiellae bacterium]|nr:lamin tail domain-containing protein [Kiritimatiellia bacterium]